MDLPPIQAPEVCHTHILLRKWTALTHFLHPLHARRTYTRTHCIPCVCTTFSLQVESLRATYPANALGGRRHSLATTDRTIKHVADGRIELNQSTFVAAGKQGPQTAEWYDQIEMPSPVRCEFKRFGKSRSYRGFLKRSLTIGRIRGVSFDESSVADARFERSGFRYPGGFGRKAVSPPPADRRSPKAVASAPKRLEPLPADLISSAASTISAMTSSVGSMGHNGGQGAPEKELTSSAAGEIAAQRGPAVVQQGESRIGIDDEMIGIRRSAFQSHLKFINMRCSHYLPHI